MPGHAHPSLSPRSLLFAATIFGVGIARGQGIPISTVPGDAVDTRAVNYPDQAGGIGALSLVWRQFGHDITDPVTIKWGLFSAASALNDILPADGYTIAAPSNQPDQIQLARTGSLGCPVGGLCPSAVVAYVEDVSADQAQLRVLRFGDPSGWNVAPTASAATATDPRIASDGGAGAVVSWLEVLGDTTRPRVQRLGGDGTRLWGPEGVPVATGVTSDDHEFEPIPRHHSRRVHALGLRSRPAGGARCRGPLRGAAHRWRSRGRAERVRVGCPRRLGRDGPRRRLLPESSIEGGHALENGGHRKVKDEVPDEE